MGLFFSFNFLYRRANVNKKIKEKEDVGERKKASAKLRTASTSSQIMKPSWDIFSAAGLLREYVNGFQLPRLKNAPLG